MKRARSDTAKDARRRLLLEAAMDEFYERGFAAARIVQVAISLLLPFMLQWSLGGFVTSGAQQVLQALRQ